jgi:FMN-dependent NADH-azoreductase
LRQQNPQKQLQNLELEDEGVRLLKHLWQQNLQQNRQQNRQQQNLELEDKGAQLLKHLWQ